MRLSNLHHASPATVVVRMLLAFVLCMGLLPLQATASPDADDIVVVAAKGDVRFTMGGNTRAAQAGTTLDLPASIRTGHDGSVDLRQGETTIGVGPDTQLELPAPTQGGDQIDRVVQPLGNAFYNVGPRGSRRLRVETPYLVAVIKGTQFNVAVEQDSSTISLFEGRLQVLATDSSAAVELNAGEIAIRHRGDEVIRVIQMKDRAAPSAGSNGESGIAATTGATGSGTGDQSPQVPHAPSPLDNEVEILIDGTSPGTAINLNAGIGDSLGAQVGVDAGIDLGAGTIDAGVDVGVDLGAASVDAGVDAGIDLGAGTIDAGVDVGVDLGAASVDVGVDAGIDLGAGTIDAGVDAGLLGADVGVDIGADLSGGDAGLDLGLDILGTEIDLGLGLGGGAATTDDTDAPSGAGGSGGLLDGLLRPRGQ